MIPTPLVGKTFCLGSETALYRDHRGDFVLADWEGSGQYRIDALDEGDLRVWVDGEETSQRRGTIAESLVVTSASGQRVTTSIGEAEGLAEGSPTSEAEGPGWVTAADGAPLWIDENPDPVLWHPGQFPLPVWRKVVGGRLEFLPSPGLACHLIDQWAIDQVDELRARGWKVQNLSQIRDLTSSFHGGESLTHPHASHLNDASWDCVLPPGTLALRLEKLYDRFHGRQRARVLVDGELAGVWYQPEEDRRDRWARSWFTCPLSRPAGGPIRLTISPPAGVPLWSVAQVRVWALTVP